MFFLLVTLYIQLLLLILFLDFHNSSSSGSSRLPVQVFLLVEFALLGLQLLVFLPSRLLKLEFRQEQKHQPLVLLFLMILLLGLVILVLLPLIYLPPILLQLPSVLLQVVMLFLQLGFLPTLLLLLLLLLPWLPGLRKFRSSLFLIPVLLLLWLLLLGYLSFGLIEVVDPAAVIFLIFLPPLGLFLLLVLLRYLYSSKLGRSLFHRLIMQFLRTLVDYGRYTFLVFLDLLAGFGYKPWRSVGWYLTVILGFAVAYYSLHLPWNEALVFSVASFHGRGFFPSNSISLSDPMVVLAALEAVIGLVIEISFIATFTQRFFRR